MKTAACYIRVSTDDQLEYSPDSQLEKIREYCARNGFILAKENIFIEEEGVSGRKAARRQEFQRMIAKAKTKPKPFDAVIVWKFSRFARNREDSIVYKSMLKKTGIDVISVTENIGDDKMSVITEAIIEAMDEYYSLNLAEEVRRGMTERIRHGCHNSIAPFGYRIVRKELVIFPEQADIIREVYSRFCSGWGQKQLAAWLNSLGVTTNRGGKIENRTIAYWLSNPVYHGYVRWHPVGRASSKRYVNTPDVIIVKGHHEPIIDEATWEAVQKKRDGMRAKFSERSCNSPRGSYALSGLVKCSCCGSSLSAVCGRKYLQCTGYAHGLCSISHHVSYELIWLMLLSAIENDLTDGVFRLDPVKPTNSCDDAAVLISQIERTETRLRRIREAFEAGIYTLDEYRSSKSKLTSELQALRTISADKKTSPDNGHAFAEKEISVIEMLKSPESTETEKNYLLKYLIKEVIFNKADYSLSIIYNTAPSGPPY